MENQIEFLNIRNELQKISMKMMEISNESLFVNRIKSAYKRLDNEKMNVLIVGEFSRGKSTFINALLGQPILPAKVNPTTATINILLGNDKNNMVIEYENREDQTIELPIEGVNKFLNNYITTNNREANKIRKVFINIPGKLEKWKCVLVDTPGVNDLDSSREEITFKYLSEADACIVLLDSQQPLSESERGFLKDKVLANDINRLVFVINRIDDSEDIPDGPVAERLKNHVKKLMIETLPEIKEPHIFAVSSKKTLKSRHKNEESPWEKSFDVFECQLFDFISKNAVNGKLPEHLIRLINISKDMIECWKEEVFELDCSDNQLEELYEKLKNEENMLKLNNEDLNLMIQKQKINLQKDIITYAKGEFNAIKIKLSDMAESITDSEDFIELKSKISQELRRATEDISRLIENNKKDFENKFYDKLNKLYVDNDTKSISTILDKAVKMDIKVNQELLISDNNKNEETKDIIKTIATSGAIGYLAGALFGPIGVAASIIGSGVAGYIMGEKIKQEKIKKIADDLQNQINNILNNMETNSQEISEYEINSTALELKQLIDNRIEMIQISLNNKQSHLNEKKDDLENKKDELRNNISLASAMLEQLYEIKRKL